MVKPIGNPLSWSARTLLDTGHSTAKVGKQLQSDDRVTPRVHRLEIRHLRMALKLGWQDTIRFRSDVVFLVALYPLIGITLFVLASNVNFVPAIFPMISGFALLGPVATVGLYALSKQYEEGEAISIPNAFSSLASGSIGAVMVLGCYLLVLFTTWMAWALYVHDITLGDYHPASIREFLIQALSTPEGWGMIWLGCGIGAIYGLIVLMTTIVSFPMLVDRPVGLPMAVVTSLKLALKCPLAVLSWGAIVVALLIVGILPMFIGLVIVLPVLGHGTWHLYRMAVSFD